MLNVINTSIEKTSVLTIIGALFASLFGGWDGDMWTLTIFMLIDWITGLVLAGVFRKSPKTESGTLESNVGFKGLCRKGTILFLVIIATRLDIMMNLNGILRTGTIMAFVCNEALSIIENTGLMGIKYPKILMDAIDRLKDKQESSSLNDKEKNNKL